MKCMRLLTTCLLCALGVLGCASGSHQELTPERKDVIRLEIEQALKDAYDLSKPDVAERMLSLYPKSGRVISANGGRASASRDSLEAGIRYFWNNVGLNMRQPRWVWDRFYVDVLSPTAAVVTATYHIPHRTPWDAPHVLGGAMTMAFERQGSRWVIVQEHLSDLPQTMDSVQATTPTYDNH